MTKTIKTKKAPRLKTLKLKWSEVRTDLLERLHTVEEENIKVLPDGSWLVSAHYLLKLDLADTNAGPKEALRALHAKVRQGKYARIEIENDSQQKQMPTC